MSEVSKNSEQATALSQVDRRALKAVAAQFFVNGALFASFVPRLPEIRDRVDLSTASIGILLSIGAASGVAGSLVCSRVIDRWGTRRVLMVAGTIVPLSLPIIGLATTPLVLLIGFIGMMSIDVLVDVSMNMQGSWLSARRHAPVMNRLHGLWSLGTLAGGFASSRIAAAGVSLTVHLFVVAALLLGVLIYVGKGLLREDEEHSTEPTSSPEGQPARRISLALVMFFFIGAFALAAESTSTDWAAFRLSDDFGLAAGAAAFGYVAVTVGMTVGRLAGDWALAQIGQRALTRLSVLVAGVGLAIACFVDNRYSVLVGYTATGLGLATMFPAIYDAAAKFPGRPGAGLGALSAGLRVSSLLVPLSVGALTATSLSVGAAIGLVTLPCLVGFVVIEAKLTGPNGATQT